MEKLFCDSEIFVKERPNKLTTQQQEKFCNDLAAEIISNGWSSDERDVIANDVEELSMDENGYELAKDLEKVGHADYDIDSAFVVWLDGLYMRKKRLIENNLKEWVIANKIEPKFNEGDEIEVLFDKIIARYKAGQVIYIIWIHSQLGLYTVNSDKQIKGGSLIPFEILEKYGKVKS